MVFSLNSGGRMLFNSILLTFRSLLPFIVFALLLTGCGSLADVQLPRFTPVPTLARLPSVTPAAATPTDPPPLPTLTTTPAATAVPVVAKVRVGANVRSGPGTTFEIVGIVGVGKNVALLGVADDWYKVRTADDVVGWMIGSVLTIPEDAAAQVPRIQPTP